MTLTLNDDTLRPAEAVEALIARFGIWRVAAALAGQMLRPRLPDLHHLPDHLRRDIGLPDLPARRADQVWQRDGGPRADPAFRK
ncbi:hypothetical protein GEU84_016835 [Fertoebacter nigrum]|uniref:DUF1127 domain-containing protein n=1 Tax=Fertoeibacter niger TaxID=2656921 RepID=A0A8X8H9E2_9RHOB|nr:hypothetical protein [Fertoeibacter niger]NUB46066.1 hypothetical protein [Fertoeibacter niger]